MMDDVRTPNDYRRAIKELVDDAERALQEELAKRDAGDDETGSSHMPEEEVEHYMQGLNLAISEEAMLALRAEFLRFSTVFDTARSREAIKNSVAEVTKPLIEEWINRNMADITREVVSEAIGQIAQVRPMGTMNPPE